MVSIIFMVRLRTCGLECYFWKCCMEPVIVEMLINYLAAKLDEATREAP